LKRIQRKIAKGWCMPENTVYVGRPTKWGNPFKTGLTYRNTSWLECMFLDLPFEQFQVLKMHGITPKNITEVLELYRLHLLTQIKIRGLECQLGELKGKDLACWCPLSSPCHADILVEMCQKFCP
jgi:hypothetical protein